MSSLITVTPVNPVNPVIMNSLTHEFLFRLGFEDIGEDPEARDHHIYHIDLSPIHISVPKAGCSPSDIAKLIFHAGAREARREIRTAHEVFLRTLAV